jgi:hypothetical protein
MIKVLKGRDMRLLRPPAAQLYRGGEMDRNRGTRLISKAVVPQGTGGLAKISAVQDLPWGACF